MHIIIFNISTRQNPKYAAVVIPLKTRIIIIENFTNIGEILQCDYVLINILLLR